MLFKRIEKIFVDCQVLVGQGFFFYIFYLQPKQISKFYFSCYVIISMVFMGSKLFLTLRLVMVVSMNYNQIFIVSKKIFRVMYWEIKICLMLLSAVKFRQNTVRAFAVFMNCKTNLHTPAV